MTSSISNILFMFFVAPKLQDIENETSIERHKKHNYKTRLVESMFVEIKSISWLVILYKGSKGNNESHSNFGNVDEVYLVILTSSSF